METQLPIQLIMWLSFNRIFGKFLEKTRSLENTEFFYFLEICCIEFSVGTNILEDLKLFSRTIFKYLGIVEVYKGISEINIKLDFV